MGLDPSFIWDPWIGGNIVLSTFLQKERLLRKDVDRSLPSAEPFILVRGRERGNGPCKLVASFYFYGIPRFIRVKPVASLPGTCKSCSNAPSGCGASLPPWAAATSNSKPTQGFHPPTSDPKAPPTLSDFQDCSFFGRVIGDALMCFKAARPKKLIWLECTCPFACKHFLGPWAPTSALWHARGGRKPRVEGNSQTCESNVAVQVGGTFIMMFFMATTLATRFHSVDAPCRKTSCLGPTAR